MIYDIEQGFLLRRKVNLSLNISSNLAPAMPVLAAGILRLRCVYVQFCSQPRKPVIRISVVFLYFCNTVVVPPTLLSAFQLPQSSLLTLTQYAFLATALACFAQAFCGHRRAIMEGPVACGGEPSLLSPLAKHRAGHRSTISLPVWRWGLRSPAC